MTTPAEKARFREDWRGRRRDLPLPVRAAQSAALTEALLQWYLPRAEHRRVASVMSYGTEPDTARLHARLHREGVEVLVPVIEPERQMSWVRWFPDVSMGRSSVAPIQEPLGDRLTARTMQTVDLVVVPALVVDAHGYRMGQGGGYYDRFLDGLRAERERTGRGPLTVAAVFEHELVRPGVLPVESFDQPVDAVVTARGVSWTDPEA
ncbi:5-formyltetrahydrofolate cyclo-ligase [Micrococcus terreus]|uniref:5-formyltetrahydrofolate cyclo-ligase n=1 Tax=Micrococcus terreus TaxID=574650 RepID=A0A1I7ME88_9MICC|nr:5-formyltetrahydrofolate cyclo-ligase [Micrococcus terreus]SFV20247.1 5-formyltetrahydrofolate cyclo-ligase [Micrococcus terreus]